MARPEVEKALSIYRKVQKPEKPGKKLKDLNAAAKGVKDPAALFLLSKAALHRAAEILLFELNSDDAALATRSGQEALRSSPLADEAKDLLVLAGELAWRGVAENSSLCAVYYVEVVLLFSLPDAAERLAQLIRSMRLNKAWRDMIEDITAGGEPDTLVEEFLKKAVKV